MTILTSSTENSGLHAAPPTLVFTGERHNRCYVVRIHGQNMPLPTTLFDLLAELAVTRLITATGFTRLRQAAGDSELARVLVYRLRQRLRQALGHGGETLIETGLATEYRLTLTPAQIEVESAFFEIPEKFIDRCVRETFWRRCHPHDIGSS